jgi:hypothetical protein
MLEARMTPRSEPVARRLGWLPIAAIALAGCQSGELHSTAAQSVPPSAVSTSAAPSAAATTAEAPTATASAAPPRTSASPGRPREAAAPGSASTLLATLRVAGRGPKTGYSRAQFGPAWQDVDHNGCDTRNDVLNRDLTDRTWRAGTHGCVVLSGLLAEPYTGRVVTFSKARASDVQIDHAVALSDAWQKGAAGWPAGERLAFANDPLELLAVDGPANESKGDGDAATWLPPYKGYRCAYVARQVAVKSKYQLTVTPAEHDAIAGVLAGCPAQEVPAVGLVQASPVATVPARSVPVQPAATSALSAAPIDAGAVYYRNCAAARAAGKAPVYRADPGYRAGLDADHDGIGCE